MRMRPASAFTLVELLVALGIITLLLGILLPIISKARAAANRTLCASHLRTMGQALHDRANETKGYLPLAGIVRIDSSAGPGSLPTALNDTSRVRYVYVADPLPWTGPTRESVAPFPAAMLPNLGITDVTIDQGTLHNWQQLAQSRRTLDVYRCPACAAGDDPDAHYPPLTLLRVGDVGYTIAYDMPFDYALNAGLLGFDYRTESRALRGHVTSVRDASRMVVLGDIAIDIYANYWSPAENSQGSVSLADALLNNGKVFVPPAFDLHRHNGRMNILFLDGHVEDLPIEAGALSAALLIDR